MVRLRYVLGDLKTNDSGTDRGRVVIPGVTALLPVDDNRVGVILKSL